MNQVDPDILRFLQQQLAWCAEQDKIYEGIERKLYAMKSLAQYRLIYELSATEIDSLNCQLQQLRDEILLLEQQLEITITH